ncbi:hypothetical protein LAZ67_11003268 [Cordylochernes scorpioides]|uniref:Integrase catalytic domain-containing protein n=1 Tax=Cordylochernes scorpioides TaxID=51811 RepID=A0ABY6L2F6_9ARAC|nr:hypothetical protein LAZ67_11003268 [Cordylochernes scorpioides]
MELDEKYRMLFKKCKSLLMDYGLGVILSHRNYRKEECPIAFASRTLTEAEKRYSQLEKEALSITYGDEKSRQYLLGRKFVLVTDNLPLIHIFSPQKPISICAASRIKRWSLKSAAFNYTEEFRKDNGRQFVSGEFEQFTKMNGIRYPKTSPYNPSTNGLAERYVREFKNLLRKNNGKDDLETNLQSFLFAHRASPQTVIKEFPGGTANEEKFKINILEFNTKMRNPREVFHEAVRRQEQFTTGCEVYFRNYATGPKRRVFEWYKRFKEGREETADNERSRRPFTSTTPEKVDKVLELMREDRNCQGGRRRSRDIIRVDLRRLREAIRQKRPELCRSKSWILHHDNAPAHTALKISKFLQGHSTSVFPLPPYSPDLAPCDFFLFGKLKKKKLKGRKFQSIEEIKVESKKDMKAPKAMKSRKQTTRGVLPTGKKGG